MAQDQGGSGGGSSPSTVVDQSPDTLVDTGQRLYNLPQYDPPDVPNQPTIVDQQVPYDPQSIQGTPQQPPAPSAATPTEQAAAQGGGVPNQILSYFGDLGQGLQYLYGQWPQNVGGVGTPTELRYGETDPEGNYAGYGPTSYQWSESPGSLNELAQGRTPPGPALAAADTVASFLINFGIRPEFITPFVSQSLGLSATDMTSMGYIQDLYGRWIALEFGDVELVGGSDYAYSDGGGGYGGGGYGGGGSYRSPSGFRSGYTSGLINWRIGI